VTTSRGKLPSTCSIFQAEGQALLQVIRFAATMSPQPDLIEIISERLTSGTNYQSLNGSNLQPIRRNSKNASLLADQNSTLLIR
jgi:hypothetical protein